VSEQECEIALVGTLCNTQFRLMLNVLAGVIAAFLSQKKQPSPFPLRRLLLQL
jgi:hypothetical protein